MAFKAWRGSRRVWGMRALLFCALSLFILAPMGACTVNTTTTSTNATGSGALVVNWTIASSSDGARCSAYGAQTISIQVLDASGIQVGSTTASCSALSATVSALPVGNYSIRAQLLDVNGGLLAALSAPVATSISGSANASVTIDFPAAAFTTPVAGTGTLVVDWTIAMAADSTLCAAHSAQTMSIQVFSASNAQYGAPTMVACSALSVSIPGLPVGTYTLEAQLLDVNGASITTLVGPVSEAITDGGTTTQAIDFPEESFEAPTANSDTGSLTVTWTVAGSTSNTGCTANSAASIVLQLLDPNSVAVGTAQTASCTAFSATLPNLTPGTFTLTATLVDSAGNDVTTTAALSGVVINAGVSTAQPVDFPTNSFLTSAAGTGSIGVSWTIASGVDPTSCTTHDAASISLQLYDSSGTTPLGAAILDPCAAFSATITNLQPGAYSLSAQLVNTTATVSSLVPPQPVTVVANAAAPLAFDFPGNSF